MELSEVKMRVAAIEAELPAQPCVEFHRFERDGRGLVVMLTERLRKSCKRGRVWQSKAFLTALKNGAYGFDADRSRSRGGSDGLFLLDREFEPRNEMNCPGFVGDGFV
ncbi:MAG: hypothetical protein ACE366_18605 [Bradymonadia bacterium]